MKKLLCLVVLVAFLGGCAGAAESEFWKHNSMYQNFDHLRYSWSGYQDCGPEYTKATKAQGWWGSTTDECKK